MRSSSLASFLTALLALSSCRPSLSTGVKLDSRLSSYVPSTATLLAGLDADALIATPFYKRHRSELNVPAFDEMAARIGVDPRRDLSTALVVWEGGQPLLLTRGRFTAEAVQSHLLSLGSKQSQYRKQRIYGSNSQLVFFPAKDIAIGGSSPAIRALIDRNRLGISPALLQRIGQLPKASQLWAVSSQGLPLDLLPARLDVQSALQNLVGYVTGINAGIAFDDGAHIHADLLCASPEDAKQVHDAMRGGIGLARLTTKDSDVAMLKLYAAIQVGYEEQTVHVHADLPAALADQLIALISSFEARRGRLPPR